MVEIYYSYIRGHTLQFRGGCPCPEATIGIVDADAEQLCRYLASLLQQQQQQHCSSRPACVAQLGPHDA